MVDRYWRKIEDVENNIENAMRISSILLKVKGYDDKLSDLSKIGTNEGNISSNTGNISTNTGAISTNSGQISTNTGAISTNSGQIITNTGAISTNSERITTNEGTISSNLSKIDTIKEFLISFENFKKSFDIEKQIFRFNRNSHFYVIFEKEITHDFTKNSLLFIDNSIHYKYDNLLNDYYRLQHQYDIYDDINPISFTFKRVQCYFFNSIQIYILLI